MKPITLEKLRKLIDARFGGKLLTGEHDAGGAQACILEAYSAACGVAWTDDPEELDIWDLRPLNDIKVPDLLRTEWIPRVLIAYQGARYWPVERQKIVTERLAVLTIQRIVAEFPGLPESIRRDCREAADLERAAAMAAGVGARAAARAAGAAAGAAGAAREKVFVLACEVWIEAAAEEG